MAAQERPYEPPLSWRFASSFTTTIVGVLSRGFLYALSKTESRGLDRFLEILDNRKDETSRTRGLITISNHVSVLDDPMMWGVLPLRYFINPNSLRWSLGSYDICFKNGRVSTFFSLGNTLPTHRIAHSQYGGLFQPTMTQIIRLLSDPHSNGRVNSALTSPTENAPHIIIPHSDPFSSSELTYSTTGSDSFSAPSAYPIRRFSWVHIFPEGMIHQHPDKVMRYFKWGVARLILEAEPCPDVLPVWIDGPQQVMDDRRTWPRPIPRPGKDVSVTFGGLVDRDAVLEPFRERWRALKEKARQNRSRRLLQTGNNSTETEELGVLTDEELRYGPEAEKLRIDVTLAVRNEVLKLRRSCGLPDEDPKCGLAETFRLEGTRTREGEKEDGSVVREM